MIILMHWKPAEGDKANTCEFAMMLWQSDTILRLCMAKMAFGIEGLGVLNSALRL